MTSSHLNGANSTELVTLYLSNYLKSQPCHVDLCVQCRPMACMYILAMSWAGVHKMCVHCTQNMKSSACACVHMCTMGLVCVRHTHTVLCVCVHSWVWWHMPADCSKWLPNVSHFEPNCMYTSAYGCLSKTQYFDVVWSILVDSCSLPEYGFFNGTLFIVIDEIVSPVRLKPPCPIQWVMYKDLGNKTATLLSPAVCE